MTYRDRYLTAVADINKWAMKKKQREDQLKIIFAQQGRDLVSAAYLIDQDQVMKECQIMLDRAVQLAAALGPAALLESQGTL